MYKAAYLFSFFVSVLCFSSCGDVHSHHERYDITEPLSYADTFSFEFSIEDIGQEYLLGMNCQWDSESYPFQNIYWHLTTIYPNGSNQTETINLNFTTPQGVVYGNCWGNSCETKWILQQKIKFRQEGDYQLKFSPYTRSEQLVGIREIDLYLDALE